ncbi:MAG: hypothetical protein LC792_00155 [Actinobacteria bacterium]|nr:hypothetical protein [Actinomycetota bacterium]
MAPAVQAELAELAAQLRDALLRIEELGSRTDRRGLSAWDRPPPRRRPDSASPDTAAARRQAAAILAEAEERSRAIRRDVERVRLHVVARVQEAVMQALPTDTQPGSDAVARVPEHLLSVLQSHIGELSRRAGMESPWGERT